jgi:CRP-like cAMP-binding protein
VYGENAPPSWARLPGARCRAVEHLAKLEGLQEFEVLEGLEDEFFHALAIAAAVLEIGAGTTLYREGEPSGAVYFMREGRAKLYRSWGGPKPRDQILGVVGDGSVLGLGPALEGRPQNGGAAALTDCVLYAVFRDDLLEIMGRFPEGAVRLARILAARTRELEDLVGDLVFHSLPLAPGDGRGDRHLARGPLSRPLPPRAGGHPRARQQDHYHPQSRRAPSPYLRIPPDKPSFAALLIRVTRSHDPGHGRR